jgi:hypothetical protein
MKEFFKWPSKTFAKKIRAVVVLLPTLNTRAGKYSQKCGTHPTPLSLRHSLKEGLLILLRSISASRIEACFTKASEKRKILMKYNFLTRGLYWLAFTYPLSSTKVNTHKLAFEIKTNIFYFI